MVIRALSGLVIDRCGLQGEAQALSWNLSSNVSRVLAIVHDGPPYRLDPAVQRPRAKVIEKDLSFVHDGGAF